MKEKVNKNLKGVDPDVWQQARIKALTAKVRLADWIMDAIKDKIKREAA